MALPRTGGKRFRYSSSCRSPNAVSVKIQWDDGEQVTWKRDALATRPLEILDAADKDDQPPAPVATDSAEGITAATEAEQPAAPSNVAAVEPTATAERVQETTAKEPEPSATEPEPTATEPLLEPIFPR
jgi:hypothetical protein